MNILFVTTDSEMYGSTRSLIDLLKGIMPKGVKPLVILPTKGRAQRFLEDLMEYANYKLEGLRKIFFCIQDICNQALYTYAV